MKKFNLHLVKGKFFDSQHSILDSSRRIRGISTRFVPISNPVGNFYSHHGLWYITVKGDFPDGDFPEEREEKEKGFSQRSFVSESSFKRAKTHLIKAGFVEIC